MTHVNLTESSPLYDKAQAGGFEENTAGDNLREEERLLTALDLERTFILGLDERYGIVCFLQIGYALQDPSPRPRLPLDDTVLQRI